MQITSILPRSKKYPTGQNPRIQAMHNELRKRLRKVYKEAGAYAETLLPTIATTTSNALAANATGYRYQLDPLLVSQTSSYLEALLNEIIYGNAQGEWTQGWWANAYASGAYTQAAEQVVTQAQLLAADAGVTAEVPSLQYLTAESVVLDPGFQNRISHVYARLFEDMKGFTADDKKNMAGILSRGMVAGKSPRVIANELEKSGGQQDWRCLRIASTEINNAYRAGAWQETDTINEDVFGDSSYELMLMHMSALLPTTRKDHAARHGTICTTKEEKEWYLYTASGGAINCHCTTVDVLADKKTRKPMNPKLQDTLLKQKKDWQPASV